jgi:D-alanine-D-alanine ligase
MKVALVYNTKNVDTDDVINIFGMSTKEHYSEIAVERVAKALESGGHTVKIVEGGMSFIDELKNVMPRVVSGERPGIVFNMAYGIQGQNRYTHVPAMLEMLGIPYVGSGPEAHSIVQDKVMTKIVLQKHNIPTPGFWVFSSSDDKFDDLKFPVIVKPKLESTSMGMKVVDNWNDLKDAVQEQIVKFSQEILVEQFIPGREFAVGLLGNGSQVEVLPIVEINLEGNPNNIQTKDDKLKKGGIDKICPAPLPKEKYKELEILCKKAFHKLGVNDYTRVDIRMDQQGNFYILELNSMASLGKGGSFYFAAKKAGYTYESLINKILDVSAERYFGESHHHVEEKDKVKESRPLRIILRSYLRTHLNSFETLLENFVNINTTPRNINENNKLGGLIAKRLEHYGLKTKTHHEFDVGDTLFFSNTDSDEYDVLILCHLDTWYTNQDFSAFRKIGNRLYGSGIAESKGGLVTLIAALQALQFTKHIDKIRCAVLLTCDDSLGGRFSNKIVTDVAKRSKRVIELKNGSLEGGIATSCSGVTRYLIDISHLHQSEGIKDVIPEMCKKVVEWKKISLKHEDARITISNFTANTSYGQTPDYGRLTLESRFKSKEQGQLFDNQISKIAKSRSKVKLDVHLIKEVVRPVGLETQKILNCTNR